MSDDNIDIDDLTDDQKNELLKQLLSKNESISADKAAVPAKVNDDFSVTRTKHNREDRAVRAGKNQWRDTGFDHTDDDNVTPDYKPVARKRKPPKKSRVECHVCGKSFNVDPRSVFGEFHRCNRCSGN